MAKKTTPTIEQIRQLLRYDPLDGNLYWLPRVDAQCAASRHKNTFNTTFSGKIAGAIGHHGYVLVGLSIGGVKHRMYGHRLAWAIHFGEWPDVVDHINGNTADNRIENLRSVTVAQNMRNRSGNIGSSSRYCGVSWDKRSQKWEASIRIPSPTGKGRGKKKSLGRFPVEAEAAKAYNRAATIYHGPFARLNQV